MTFVEYASSIAHREGKKSEVSIGNIREILKMVLNDYQYDMEVRRLFKRYALRPVKKAKVRK